MVANNRKEGAAHKTAEKAVYLSFGNNSLVYKFKLP